MSESGNASTDLNPRSGETLELDPADIFEPISFAAIFENNRPVEVDLGSGAGRFLIEAACQYPEKNFFGVERLLGRVRKTVRSASRLSLTNVRVLRLEIDYTVRYLLSPGSVSRLHLSFPDPWPKRRHQRRCDGNHPDRFVAQECPQQIDLVERPIRPGIRIFEWKENIMKVYYDARPQSRQNLKK